MNRRELLTGMAVASAAAALPAAAAGSAAQPPRAAWDRAMAVHLQAVAASDAYDAEYDRIYKAHHAEVESLPHVSMPNGYGGVRTTANRHDVLAARHGCRTLRYVETCAYDHVKAEQAFVDAADKRDAKIAAIDRKYNWEAVNEHYEALQSAIVDTQSVLLNMPAPDSAAALWKVERLYKPGDGISGEEVEDQAYADLHRFLSIGRA
jgi:hypothetical protein